MKLTAPLLSVFLSLSFTASAAVLPDRPITVSTSVAQNCTIITASGINFGAYQSISTHSTADKDAQSSITLRCTNGTTSAALQLDGGTAPNASCLAGSTLRKMSLGDTSNYLEYEIYLDADRSVPWGCDTFNQHVFPEFSNSTQNVRVDMYGRLFASQTVPAGAYTDTVVASLVF